MFYFIKYKTNKIVMDKKMRSLLRGRGISSFLWIMIKWSFSQDEKLACYFVAHRGGLSGNTFHLNICYSIISIK